MIQRALLLLKKIRIPPHLSNAQRYSTADSSTSFSSSTGFSHFRSGSTRRKPHWDLILGIILSGQTAIFINRSCVFAEDASVAELVTDKDQGRAYITGLRRIEDGSVISNSHTSKWRIFTDNGRDQFLKGKFDEAEQYFQSALRESKEGFGPRDPHVASSYNNLAELYRVRKAFEQSEPLYLEAISILEESFGADDIRVGAALHNLGQFYLSQRKLDQARTCYERALKIKVRILGDGNPDYADTMYHLGTVLHLQGNEKDSEALISESIRILEEAGEGETTSCVRRIRYLSQMQLNSNRLADAEILQRKILHRLELLKGWDSLDTIFAAEGLALTLQSLGSLTEAREVLERCLDFRKRILPDEHIQVASNMLHLARIASLNSTHIKKVKISEARDELDKASRLINKSIRIAKANLDGQKKNSQSSSKSLNNGKDRLVALTILVQSLDFVGLLEVTKHELLEERGEYAFHFEVGLALRECISIFKEPGTRSLLNNPDVRKEYLSCTKHLASLLSENKHGEAQNSRELQKLKDEVLQIEAELSSS